jgi:allophanate hydrolase subunit 2
MLTKFDGNIALKLILESNSHDTRDGFHHGGFTVRDMANGAKVNCGLRSVSRETVEYSTLT